MRSADVIEFIIEVEVENFAELRDALAIGVDRVMLDEFSIDDIRRAVVEIAGRTQIEVSGGVSLDALPELAATSVDFISVGALTKTFARSIYRCASCSIGNFS